MLDQRRKPARSLDLFEEGRRGQIEREQPLAARLRPRVLDDFVGQDHILGPGRLLRRAIQADQLSSLIFYGPPGTGKTTLALVIANTTSSHFITINAVLAGVADIRSGIHEAQERRNLHNERTILFVDEVHRFNKAQQDALLPWVENGTVILIGATTENPYFAVNRPLVSRSRIFQLRSLTNEELFRVARHALSDVRGYRHLRVEIDARALDHLVDIANGDARALLNAIELAVETTPAGEGGIIHIDLAVAEESIQKRAVLYDKEGDYHFDAISAFIKSLRGSDPDATMYWLAKMVYAGEDPQYIFRRMLVFASEDVGVADPQALAVVSAAAETFDRVGLPEGRFSLAQAALHLATAPKSNSVFAFFDALAAVERERDEEVPNHLKDASRDSESLGHGANYFYPHAYRDHWVAQQYLPDGLQGRVFYQPSQQGAEGQIAETVARRREIQLAAMLEAEEVAPESLTIQPNDKDRNDWVRRAQGDTSELLGRVRERVFARARWQRHHRVVDLNGATGLLTWEALRRVADGGVWSLCHDKTSAVALREMATHLTELDRPHVLEGDVAALPSLLVDENDGVRFDVAVGRNAFGSSSGHQQLPAVFEVMAEGGQLSLAEVFPRQAQRLCDLVRLDELEADLRDRVLRAEEEIYEDGSNPRVSWDADDLNKALTAAGFASVEHRAERLAIPRRINLHHLGNWFSPGGDRHPTFANLLRRHIEADELAQIKKLFELQLAHKDVNWSTTYIFATGLKE